MFLEKIKKNIWCFWEKIKRNAVFLHQNNAKAPPRSVEMSQSISRSFEID